jgi:transcription antitermination factor NusG
MTFINTSKFHNVSSQGAIAIMSERLRWYAAFTAPCREKSVLERLSVRGIESFLPVFRSPRKWKNGCNVELQLPLFPAYIFVRITNMERVRVLELPNVLSIVSRGRIPEPLEDEAIEMMRATLHLQQAEPHPYLVVGEKVSICAGPFAGLSGVVLRQQSKLIVVITVELLMRSVAVQVNVDDLEPSRPFTLRPTAFDLTESPKN